MRAKRVPRAKKPCDWRKSSKVLWWAQDVSRGTMGGLWKIRLAFRTQPWQICDFGGCGTSRADVPRGTFCDFGFDSKADRRNVPRGTDSAAGDACPQICPGLRIWHAPRARSIHVE